MRIGLTSPLANHLYDQSHVATQLPRVSNPKAESKPARREKNMRLQLRSLHSNGSKGLGVFFTKLSPRYLPSRVSVGKRCACPKAVRPLVDSSLLKINLSIPLLPQNLPAENGECTLSLGTPTTEIIFTSPSESSRLCFCL